jgi:hypothetical protein
MEITILSAFPAARANLPEADEAGGEDKHHTPLQKSSGFQLS